ncbi:MAG: ribosome recycling factor [Chitinophagales bacterium]|nr:ribosome recycling factor [Chitinophagales bacterium]
MNEEVQLFIDDARDTMTKALAHLEEELTKVRAGKANATMLAGITVDYYGVPTPLAQVANVNTPDARTLLIKPWEKNMLGPIEKAILMANIGLTPQNDGEVIRLNIPMLTEERRKEMVKKTKLIGEESRVAIRNIRRNTNEAIKALQKDGVSEDEIKQAEEEVQELTNNFIAKVEKHLAVKEDEIMKV